MSENPTRHVLVTGFGPWAEFTHNPSTELARAIDGMRVGDVLFHAHAPLPVAFADAAQEALDRARALSAKAILALGLAAATPHIRIEKRGHNLVSSSSPDAKARVLAAQKIVSDAKSSYDTFFDVDAIASLLREQHFDARVSTDAGGYVCNDLYFRLLHANEAPVLFVHVPSNAHTIEGLASALASTFANALR